MRQERADKEENKDVGLTSTLALIVAKIRSLLIHYKLYMRNSFFLLPTILTPYKPTVTSRGWTWWFSNYCITYCYPSLYPVRPRLTLPAHIER